MRAFDQDELKQLWRSEADSHKGQNGRVLVIGGSKLFHTSIFWSADVASRVVDLVHFASPANENNEVVRKRIKEGFWSGIVVDWSEVEMYIEEDDCVLIGPGMPREEGLVEGERMTGEIVNGLLERYPRKKWVVDGGALQEVDKKLLNRNMIITPHLGEWERLGEISDKRQVTSDLGSMAEQARQFSNDHDGVTVLLKNVGGRDLVVRNDEVVVVEGGNEGLTKGGTGDVLAGLVAGFYSKNVLMLAAGAASWVVKKAADKLYEEKGTFYNAGDLVQAVGGVMGELGA